MAEAHDVLQSLKRVQALPDGVHWFCPRENRADHGIYFEEDVVLQTGKSPQHDSVKQSERVADAHSRQDLLIDALQIFAYNGVQAEGPQNWLETQLAEQLSECDICVREFHRARRKLKQLLVHEYNEEDVTNFMRKFDALNNRRIEMGLLRATETLEEADPAERSISKLDTRGVHIVFEALNCRPFISNQDELDKHFSHFFGVIQSKKPLKLGSYTPAMAWFLFQDDPDRLRWACREWQRMKRNMLAIEFEHCVRDPLLIAMSRVQLANLEKEFLPVFWRAVRSIVGKLDKDVITQELRALDGQGIESDVCRLAFSHLQIDSDAFVPLLSTMQCILETSPLDFWESLGTVSSTAWLDQFFTSPALERLIRQAESEGDAQTTLLDSLLSWIVPFIESIKPANQPPATRTLVVRLLGKYSNEAYSARVNRCCSEVGLRVLSTTLSNLNSSSNTNIASPMTSELLEVTQQHMLVVRSAARTGSSTSHTAAVDIVHHAIALDCKCFLLSGKSTPDTAVKKTLTIPFHAPIWKQAALSLDHGNTLLAKKILSAIKPLGTIEPFVTKLGSLPPHQAAFNKTLQSLSAPICELIERIADLGPSTLKGLFEDSDSSHGAILPLFSSDKAVKSAAVELIKQPSDSFSRRDAIAYLLDKHFVPTLNGLSLSIRQIEQVRSFVPAWGSLRILSDVLDITCNQQDGVLRSEPLTRDDARFTFLLWQSMWRLLRMMFSTTETWSQKGHDKQILMNFCRDAMEFADKAFDQFGVIKGALAGLEEEGEILNEAELGKKLIELPKRATADVIKWLKLRDDFLVSRSCALVCKLLTRLKEFDEQLEESNLSFVMDVVVGSSKSTLSPQQKAELSRALETHAGIFIDHDESSASEADQKPSRRRTETIDLDRWVSQAQRQRSERSATSADVFATATPTFQRLMAKKAAQTTARGVPQPLPKTTPTVNASEFKRKREQEMQERKRRDALAAAQHKKRIGGSAVGEGSGARGLGVYGKEHEAPSKGSDIMVDSSESSEDEELDDMDRELFGIGDKAKKSSRPLQGLTKEQANAIAQSRQGPVKKQRLVRSQRDMRARLAPDLSPLHKQLLSWEYFHEGGFPPNSGPENYRAVLSTFRDPYDYQRTFQPLLVLEAWNGFLKAKEENNSKVYELKIASRSSVDAFLELSSTISHADGKEISEGDIVLLSKSNNPTSSPNEPHCLSRVSRMTRKKAHIEVLYRAMPGTSLAPSLSGGSSLFGVKVTSIIPLEREYGALLGLQYYDLCDEITKAKPSPLLKYSDETLQPLIKNYVVNKAQAKAIKSVIDNDAFTLVQGPPGSGKTKTIVAIVGALLTASLRAAGSVIQQPKSGIGTTGVGTPKKMLVCAPSNAAVDELVMRFKDGIRTTNGEYKKISIVRLGRSDAINANVVDVTLEELVNKKLNISNDTSTASAETQKIMMEHKDISAQLRIVREEVNAAEASGGMSKDLKEQFDTLRRKKATLSQRVDAAKDNEGAQNRQADLNRRRAQQQVLDEAHVICATLSGSGHDMFQNLNIEFETVIIDEAAQCVELSCLIPLKYGCAKCVLVGDPQQLPPTVFSRDAARFKYEQSLFVRMQENHRQDVHLLDTQYRMHPEISAFPSNAFYDSRLLDGKDMAQLRARPWHATDLLSPYRFFDVQGQQQSAPRGHSLVNLAEVNIALQLYRRLITDFRSYNFQGKIGIITPYKSQLRELREQFQRHFGPSVAENIEFNTTDAFQGRESEIIIFSCVRASPAGGIGFLQDIRRMNVGLTRAMSSLWVLGNSQSLMKGEYWARLVTHSKESNRYTDGDLQGMLGTPLKIVRKVETTSISGQRVTSTAHTALSRRPSDAMDVDSKSRVYGDANKARSSTNSTSAVGHASGTARSDNSKNSGTLMKQPTNPQPPLPAKRKRAASASSDVEMVDAPPSEPSRPDPSSTKPTDINNTQTAATHSFPSRPATSVRDGGTPNRQSSALQPSVSTTGPPPPKKKREVNVLMKRKKPNGK